LPNRWGPNCHKICCLRTYLHSYQTAVSPVGFHQMFWQLPGRAWIFRRLSKSKTRQSCDARDASPICRLHYCVFSLQKLRNNNFILRQDKPYALLKPLLASSPLNDLLGRSRDCSSPQNRRRVLSSPKLLHDYMSMARHGTPTVSIVTTMPPRFPYRASMFETQLINDLSAIASIAAIGWVPLIL